MIKVQIIYGIELTKYSVTCSFIFPSASYIITHDAFSLGHILTYYIPPPIKNNIDIFPENYAGVIFFSQEHFGCDEESCGQGSQAVQQWNDQEIKINFNYVGIIECCQRPMLSKNSTVLFNVMQKERQVGIWVESKRSLSSRGSIFGMSLIHI